jgi:NAD(P)-dependent dehydrogenase (short-subunit alcohol dehydrogenase family)
MGNRLFITGNSSGLGRGLTEAYLARNWSVYGLSRRGSGDLQGAVHDIRCDLADHEVIPMALDTLLAGVGRLDLVILNAGILGRIADLEQTPLSEIREVMEINVWSNKTILDWLKGSGIPVKQIVLISSGAAVNGNRGWGAYSLSKATLNMLGKLYAHEFPQTHIASLAPGLVDTAMQDHLCEEVDAALFPSVNKLRKARGTASMPTPRQAGEQIADVIPGLLNYASGDFLDIRTMGSDC